MSKMLPIVLRYMRHIKGRGNGFSMRWNATQEWFIRYVITLLNGFGA
jgi:hypothetical protein